MFGLEKQSKDRRPEEFEFDLEREMKLPNKYGEKKSEIMNQMRKIKALLRAGGDQEEFHQLGTVLHGYVSLLKVMDRAAKKRSR